MRSIIITLLLALPLQAQVYKLTGEVDQQMDGYKVTVVYYGSAVCVYSNSGKSYLVTAIHCVGWGSELEIDGVPCKVVATEPLWDLALLEMGKELESVEVCEGGLEVGDEVEAVGVVGSADKPSRRPSRLTQADDTLIMVGDQVSGGMSGGAIMKGGRLAGVISAKIGDSYSKAVGVGRIRGMIQRFSERMAK